ncbi:glycosyltransferase family 4 protein [Caldisalinibacter kiritimatiensis]|uniref:Undecaprenyl-phosphate N-acetylglucosaminyl 1-phosphate transferase n=1 Tax=Caldisalinibacter kiritimatiensis TaxID=1304284 RepID=R1AYI1_9FIRM|nr:MraY family glycosyltransferase [Caldisalinibacter kiritimatiensis]EOD01757.1 Undecaprenyl-phosphate N-acetylglucosaminyl 1-phosphate transferase [Caldisalinibacter kiritimatiensis]
MEKYYIPFVIALVATYILTPFVKRFAEKIGAIDVPKDNRRIHKKPIPLMGGLAIYISTVVSMLLFLPMDKTSIAIIAGGTIIVISGIIDDMKSLSPKLKLLAQIVAAIILIWGDIKIEFITNPFASTGMTYLKIFSIPVTIFWVVGITNTLNLIDGLDGLASGVASIAAVSLLFVSSINGFPTVMMMSAILAGAALGFLPHNFNPAKIFMGDTGSLFLGYMLSVIAIEGVMKSVAAIAIAVPVLALGLPIFDTTFAIFRRFLNGRPIMEADKGHLHHRLLDRGFTQKQTVLVLYVISMFLGTIAVLLADIETDKGIIILGVVSVFILLGASRLGLFDIDSLKKINQRKNANN